MVKTLQKKIFRDLLEARKSLMTIVCICALGIALFSGINLYISALENDLNDYYSEFHLADSWIYKNEMTNRDAEKVKEIKEVKDVQLRKTFDVELPQVNDASIRIHAFNGDPQINVPDVLEGRPLAQDDDRGILLDSRFAEENNIAVGDRLDFYLGEAKRTVQVRGIARNVENTYYAPEGLSVPDHKQYGFAYANADAFPDMPMNEMTMTTEEHKSLNAETIRHQLGFAAVVDRAHQSSYEYIQEDVSSMKPLATLFSLAFFLTAALITWITVGRIMRNQRQHLGTMRSLGYRNGQMIRNYTWLGIGVTLPSMIIGWILGRFFLANLFYRLALRDFTLEDQGVDLFSYHFFVVSLLVLCVTCGATLLSGRKSLKQMPAHLMRPLPPSKGHRILLERVAPIWRKLNFSNKFVTRNLFRNKTHLFMGMTGIIGSTALVISGLGFVNSADRMMDQSFHSTMNYDTEIKLKAPLTPVQAKDLIASTDNVTSYDPTMALSVYVDSAEEEILNPYLIVLEQNQTSLQFTNQKGERVSVPENGVMITPRMAHFTGKELGDQLQVETIEGKTMAFPISAIVDFPVGNEIYMSKEAFQKATHQPFLIQALLVHGENLNVEPIEQDPRVRVVESKDETRENLQSALSRLRMVQVILIGFAALLTMGVMFILGNLNFTERIRELATLKVLGFRKREMKKLVLAENIWITIIALPFGLLAGYGLLSLILNGFNNPDMEIAPYISPVSLLLATGLMLLFTFLVNLLLARKFKNVDMISSLKSVE